ncbi:hypothetical protein CEXT_428441 [Caerostris extrusa]|uniref:DUF2849 domain-containing protein n=1 Tax=Caerostris extrusa TaxID=172846 RepID=A0AAV4WZW9_CAEEX|nr:hypothetical protein CEXT_428441 [Caerostris extrusa]
MSTIWTPHDQVLPRNGRYVLHAPHKGWAEDIKPAGVVHGPYVIGHVTLVLSAVFHPDFGDVQEADHVTRFADVVAGRYARTLAHNRVVQVPSDAWHGVAGGDALQ